jgi:hypothetical protein
MKDGRKRQQPAPSLPMFGTSITVGAAVLILGGYWMDQRAGGGYKRTLLGLVFALLYVLYETWKLTRLLAAMDRKGKKDAGEPPATPPDPPAP